MTIVVTGGSGFIGTKLVAALLAKKHTVIVIDIVSPSFTHENLFFIECDLVTEPMPYNVLDRTDAIINLVGYPIIKKWTPDVKKNIRESRIESARRIVESIENASLRPTVCITASATGFYGDTGHGYVDEQSPKGEGYLAEVVSEWEQAMKEIESFGVRVVYMRTAPVLGRGGLITLLQKMLSWGFLLHLSKKEVTFSWIHHSDVVSAYLFALETNTLQGVVNVVAPEATTSRTFIQTLSKCFHRPILGTVPRWLNKILFGELSTELIKNSHVVPQRLIDKGFTFTYSTLIEAVRAVVKEIKNYKKIKTPAH